MSAATFNTLNFSRRLKSGGFSPEQAETLADAMAEEGLAEVAGKRDLEEFATKADIHGLKQDIKELELKLTMRMGGVGVAIVGIVLAGVKLIVG